MISESRWRAFWRAEPADRPLIGAALDAAQADAPALLPAGAIGPERLNSATLLGAADQAADEAAEVSGDAVWAAAPFQGLPWMEAICGCGVRCSGESVWAESGGDDPSGALADWRGSPWLNALLENASALAAHAQGRYAVGLPVLRGPADVMSALRGPQRFCMDVIDRPEEVRGWLEQCVEACATVTRALLEAIGPFPGGCVQASRQVWAPGPCVETQEDAAALLSPAHYRKLILRLDRQLWEGIPFVSHHLHSTGLQYLPALLGEPALTAIEITADSGGPPAAELALRCGEVQTSGKPLILHGAFTADDVAALVARLQPAGLYIAIKCGSVADANLRMCEVNAGHGLDAGLDRGAGRQGLRP